MSEKKYLTVNIVILLVLSAGILIYGFFSMYQLAIQEEEGQIKKETYITGLLDVYNRDVGACIGSVDENVENRADTINTNCLDPINESRVATLLKDWGYESELMLKYE